MVDRRAGRTRLRSCRGRRSRGHQFDAGRDAARRDQSETCAPIAASAIGVAIDLAECHGDAERARRRATGPSISACRGWRPCCLRARPRRSAGRSAADTSPARSARRRGRRYRPRVIARRTPSATSSDLFPAADCFGRHAGVRDHANGRAGRSPAGFYVAPRENRPMRRQRALGAAGRDGGHRGGVGADPG